jgi:hypothetical protein
VPLTEETMRTLQALDGTILRALNMRPEDRFTSAREMALEVERTCSPATVTETADWVESIASDVLGARAAMVADMEAGALSTGAENPEGHVLAVLGSGGSGPHSTVRLGEITAGARSSAAYGATLAAPPFMPMPPMTPPYGAYPVEGPPVTQPSSISVSTGAMNRGLSEAPGRPKSPAVLTAFFVGLTFLAGTVVYVSHRARIQSTPTFADPQPGTGTVEPMPALTPAFDLADADAGLRLATPGAGPPPAGPTAGPTTTTTTTVPPSGQRERGGRRGTVPKPATSGDDCIWYDSSGVKHYREKCLGK